MSQVNLNKQLDMYAVFMTSLITVSIIFIMWFLWASFVYRYSTERIDSKLRAKYKHAIDDANEVLLVTDAQVTDVNGKKQASATMNIVSKSVHEPLGSEIFTLPIDINCKATDYTCVRM